MTDLQQDEYDRRFAGVAKVYGDSSFQHYEKSHVMVIGIGGVGSWAVEALARTGIGEITLVDMDVVAASNVNRQLPAMTSTLGCEKVEIMAERCRQINPRIKVNIIDDFLTPENVTELLNPVPDIVLDCIDDVKAKLALMLHCRFNKIPLIVSGGAGGKLDPLKIRVADLSKTEQESINDITQKITQHSNELRKRYSLLGYQNVIGASVMTQSVTGLVIMGALYIKGIIPGSLCRRLTTCIQ